MFNRRKNREHKFHKEQHKGRSLITYTDPRSINSEQFRTLKANIEFTQIDDEMKSLIVSSSIPAEGKSTIASNLAYVMAQGEKSVLLVDADLRKPTLHRTFELNNKRGLSTLIAGEDLDFIDLVQYNSELNLNFLTSGPIPPNPYEVLSSARMKELMEKLRNAYDLVIYDAPPLTVVADSQILAAQVDKVLLVARHGYTRKDEIKRAKEALDSVNADLLGFVMNDQPISQSDGYYAYYGYNEDK